MNVKAEYDPKVDIAFIYSDSLNSTTSSTNRKGSLWGRYFFISSFDKTIRITYSFFLKLYQLYLIVYSRTLNLGLH